MNDRELTLDPAVMMESEEDFAAVFLNQQALENDGVDINALTSLNYDIRFQTSDGVELYVDRQLAKRSGVVRELLGRIQRIGASNTSGAIQVSFSESALKKAIIWFQYHLLNDFVWYPRDGRPFRFRTDQEVYGRWIRDYLEISDSLLRDIIDAAVYFRLDNLFQSGHGKLCRPFRAQVESNRLRAFAKMDEEWAKAQMDPPLAWSWEE